MLMKSSRVIFTTLIGVLVAKKRYRALDYATVVALMVTGLAVFVMHADCRHKLLGRLSFSWHCHAGKSTHRMMCIHRE